MDEGASTLPAPQPKVRNLAQEEADFTAEGAPPPGAAGRAAGGGGTPPTSGATRPDLDTADAAGACEAGDSLAPGASPKP